MAYKRRQVSSSTGTADGVAAAGVIGGTALALGTTTNRIKGLSATVVVDAETDTLTLTPKWQVSVNGSTWVDYFGQSNNAANVVLATGTAGADATVSRAIEAPQGIYVFPWVRLALVVGGTTGTTSDTYTIAYNYLQLSAGEG